MQDTYAVLPQNGEAQLRIFNGFNCPVIVDVPGIATHNIESLDFWKAPPLPADGEKIYPVNISNVPCSNNIGFYENVAVKEMQVTFNKYVMRT